MVFETIVLDVDGGVISQENLISKYNARIIHLQKMTGDLRFWCHKNRMNELQAILIKECRTRNPKAIFYGSGDYHHLAYLGISLIKEPITIIHFDNHSDYWREEFVNMISLGKLKNSTDYFNYGSWINPALRLPYVKKVVQFGIDGDFKFANYLPFPKGRWSHSFDLVIHGLVETYPNFMRQSTLLGKINGSFACIKFKSNLYTTDAHWKNMQDHGGIQSMVEEVVSKIQTEAVYITIDKDVLNEKESFSAYPGFTGKMHLPELLNALSYIIKTKKIVGLDVCGDASDYNAITAISTFTKKTMADRQYKKIPENEFTSINNIIMNEDVNLKLMKLFE